MHGRSATPAHQRTESEQTSLIEKIGGCANSYRLILTYLIPCHLLTSHKLPTSAFLADYPRLGKLFLPLATAIKRASLSSFDAALVAGEPYFVKRRIYLTLERARDIALRNLLRKVFIVGGYEPIKEDQPESERVRRTRVPIDEFVAAIRLSTASGNGTHLDRDEVECMLANMIYKVSTSRRRMQDHVLSTQGVCLNCCLVETLPARDTCT
jgi:hypothetical protein